MTPYKDKIEEILQELPWVSSKNFNEAMSLSKQRDILVKESTTELLKLMEEFADEVIGDDDTGIITDEDSVDYGKKFTSSIVDRNEQRQRIQQLLKGEGLKMSKELEEMKAISEKIWKTYDNEYGYVDEKLGHLRRVTTENEGNFWFFWGQFDGVNQSKLFDAASVETQRYIEKRITDGI